MDLQDYKESHFEQDKECESYLENLLHQLENSPNQQESYSILQEISKINESEFKNTMGTDYFDNIAQFLSDTDSEIRTLSLIIIEKILTFHETSRTQNFFHFLLDHVVEILETELKCNNYQFVISTFRIFSLYVSTCWPSQKENEYLFMFIIHLDIELLYNELKPIYNEILGLLCEIFDHDYLKSRNKDAINFIIQLILRENNEKSQILFKAVCLILQYNLSERNNKTMKELLKIVYSKYEDHVRKPKILLIIADNSKNEIFKENNIRYIKETLISTSPDVDHAKIFEILSIILSHHPVRFENIFLGEYDLINKLLLFEESSFHVKCHAIILLSDIMANFPSLFVSDIAQFDRIIQFASDMLETRNKLVMFHIFKGFIAFLQESEKLDDSFKGIMNENLCDILEELDTLNEELSELRDTVCSYLESD
ncbi:hypothetical protein TVAG_142210 [Trichomonas vaginalis G3]|uniref:Condensin complex subunit 1 C-terminal domain-containing protein n=1 Tax=Trichomonas vaginalis (strain ATCC PRA-98 / G3) TaxID=412133 RepID=A2EHI0_TRIV3|nr:armadillo (ARM) repeat-containing protein family [Trichomonas vaginalis G3]EAY07867.1 hypothetical protein TVAG_142210 [Trichomonas vaginalis G3]KAI5514113.1 armadillo (ARM) repeat-containing protein family [Trichomonas vaginalis G3]|eukprot:XP_001320090.1 hypothetical protein [Trichomonas vaginalis G3]